MKPTCQLIRTCVVVAVSLQLDVDADARRAAKTERIHWYIETTQLALFVLTTLDYSLLSVSRADFSDHLRGLFVVFVRA